MKLKEAIKDIVAETLLEEGKRWKFRKPHISYKEKPVKVDGVRHHKMLLRTIAHLEALRDGYPAGSATRLVISQTCSRLKRLVKQLEKNFENIERS
jgi:hypothetical protein